MNRDLLIIAAEFLAFVGFIAALFALAVIADAAMMGAG